MVGLFTILGIIAIFGVFYVLGDVGTRAGGYKVGVRFKTASGLRNAAVVSLSGVPIGAVDGIDLEPDYSVDVIMAIRPGYDIPQGSRFVIQAPLTGEPEVLIEPPRGVSKEAATLPHELLPVPNQPLGTNPTSISDLLEEGQGEVRRFDAILSEFQSTEPQLISELHSTLRNANDLTKTANSSILSFSVRAQEISDNLKSSMSVASSNIVDLTSDLDRTVRRNSGQVDQLIGQLNRTSVAFGQTVDSLRDLATNPAVKRDLVDSAHSFAVTAKTFAELSGDLRQVTGNGATQAQLRDTVANLDATAQKIDSLVGKLGGTSSVPGVDARATPAAALPPPLGPAPGTAPASPAPLGPGPSASPAAPGTSHQTAVLKDRLARFTADLAEIQIRVSQLSAARPGSLHGNTSPLLTTDRGPQSDFNVTVLPRSATSTFAGVNDIGSNGTATANLMLVKHYGNVRYGGGIEYSRLGASASFAGGSFGLEGRLYDLRHPTADAYLNFLAGPKLQLFGGERDLTHASRRTVLGLQFEL
jgi:ABC-type transporter Mla subunit MlaD